MVSINKKNKAKNSFFAGANKETMKMKRLNFFNKKNRTQIKRDVNKT